MSIARNLGPPGPVLGLDTSTDDVAVAVVEGERVIAERRVGPADGGRPRHATALMPAVEEVVAQAGGHGAIGLIAVGIGPGAFTGLRIGVATARALAQARSTPIVGVGSLDALALGLRADPRAAGRPLLVALDARRGEAFAALYAADGSRVWGPAVAPAERLAERLAGAGRPALAAGSGALRFRRELEVAGADVLAAADAGHRIAARHICALAGRGEAGDPEAIKPIYLRRPDAELWRERQRGRRRLD